MNCRPWLVGHALSVLLLLAATVGWDFDQARKQVWISLGGTLYVCREPAAYAIVSNEILGRAGRGQQRGVADLEAWLIQQVPKLCQRSRPS